MSFSTYSQCRIHYCYTGGFVSAGATYPCRATRWHVIPHGTCDFRRLIQFILAGPVYHKALTNCAALLCRACGELPVCVAVMYLTLRTGCERHGRKNPLPFPYFAAVTCRQSAPDYPREKGRFTRGWKTAVCQKQFPFNYTKSSKVEQKYSISPLKCLQSVILKSEVSIMQCTGSTKSTVSGRFKIIVAEISGVICGVKIQVAAAANMK